METAMTTQQGLNEVVINKVQRMIENQGRRRIGHNGTPSKMRGKSHRIISPLSGWNEPQ